MRLLRLMLPGLFLIPLTPPAQAGSSTWKLDPTSGDWNTAANWTPKTVPNGTDDIATFGVSNVTSISLSAMITLGGMQFESGASSYDIGVIASAPLSFTGAGVTNESGLTQSISCTTSTVDFYNASTAGGNVIYTNTSTDGFISSIITFHDDANAGSATFVNNGTPAYGQGKVVFTNNASAGSSNITVSGVFGFGSLGAVFFYDQSTAAQSTLLYDKGAFGFFGSQATAANSTLTCSASSSVYFSDNSTAEAATIACSDASNVYFQNSATAGATTITCSAGSVNFLDFSTAGAATITADDTTVHFQERSDGGTARIVLTNASTLTVDRDRPVFRVGSLEGDGAATINRVLLIGGNNLDATFSGNLESTSEGDWLTKVGTGTWTLAGTGSYPGSTTVTAGTLLVTGASTPTGSGPVKVNGGTLGGSGTIAGAVTIGTGSGAGAFLAPAHGTKTPVTLTIQGSVTFKSDSTYTYTFDAKRNRAKTDKVVANGVTIENGATLDLSGIVQGTLTQGTVFTVIKNTPRIPISGRFGNLPQGAIVTVKGNNLQASYGGGDGNDLTLTVVP